jgi:2-polyprenyl-6-methoxyphenol hydroxylase-like FAD-dependent oxidoreductase
MPYSYSIPGHVHRRPSNEVDQSHERANIQELLDRYDRSGRVPTSLPQQLLTRTTADAFPVHATFVDGDGKQETVKAKYLVGADGAHSTVRKHMPSASMEGDAGVRSAYCKLDYRDN